jgi:hypothetical protein
VVGVALLYFLEPAGFFAANGLLTKIPLKTDEVTVQEAVRDLEFHDQRFTGIGSLELSCNDSRHIRRSKIPALMNNPG